LRWLALNISGGTAVSVAVFTDTVDRGQGVLHRDLATELYESQLRRAFRTASVVPLSLVDLRTCIANDGVVAVAFIPVATRDPEDDLVRGRIDVRRRPGEERAGRAAEVVQAMMRDAPLLLVRNSSEYADVLGLVVIVDSPSVLIGKSRQRFSMLFRSGFQFDTSSKPIIGVVIVHPPDSALLDALDDQLPEGVPVFDFDIERSRSVPSELHDFLKGLASLMPAEDTLSLPLFTVSAGGDRRAAQLIQRAIDTRYSDAPRAGEAFGAELRSALESVVDTWNLDSAVSWLRSANAHLGGARPIEVIALGGSESVKEALEASAWGIYS
jgi:Protein of unknown function (DUF2384)